MHAYVLTYYNIFWPLTLSALTSKRRCFILAHNIRPKFGRTFSTHSVSLPKPSASAECHNLTFGPSLVDARQLQIVCWRGRVYPPPHRRRVAALSKSGYSDIHVASSMQLYLSSVVTSDVQTVSLAKHVLLAPVCDYFTCVHVVVFVYFPGCVFAINVSSICRFTLNTCVI